MNSSQGTGSEEVEFSRMEASFANTTVKPRKNSIEMKDVYRHTQPNDLKANAKELDFNFSLRQDHYALKSLRSLQDVFSAVQHDTHLSNPLNFSDGTQIKCLQVNDLTATWHDLDSNGLSQLLESLPNPPQCSPLSTRTDPSSRCLLVFFVPLMPAQGTSFGSRTLMTQESVERLCAALDVNPLFIMNLLGRPDYWAPQTRWETNSSGRLAACDFFCQYPRWNLHFQGAPLSVYMRYSVDSNLTTYIISHKTEDASVGVLQNILNLTLDNASLGQKNDVLLNDPLDIVTMLSTLSFEASKYHVARFRRFMFAQINKVDDHLAGLETNDRRKLSELTKELQIMSQNADSHLANADVAIITARAIRSAHARLHGIISSSPTLFEGAAHSINYVIESTEKQKMWFLNYKNRKDSTMQLVYNLVTQQDSASNIELAASMKDDSTSMNGIAALTMAFLPGTFIATVLDAGIFSSDTNSLTIDVSGLWWLWVVLTIPLTIATITSWWLYKRHRNKARVLPRIIVQENTGDRAPSRSTGFPFNIFVLLKRPKNPNSKVRVHV